MYCIGSYIPGNRTRSSASRNDFLAEMKIRNLKSRLRACKSYYRRRISKLENASSDVEINEKRVLEFCQPKMSSIALEFLSYQIKDQKKLTWSRKCKEAALLYYFHSPKLYRFQRKIHRLPSVSCLRKHLQSVKIFPGFNENIFRQLKVKSAAMDDDDCKAVILIDEMSIRNALQYVRGKDLIYGLVDYGGGVRTSTRAESVLVFMLQGLRKKWKQPICYVFGAATTKADALLPLIEECIRKVGEAGIEIAAITTDQGGNFSTLFKSMGCTVQNPFIKVDDRTILIFADPPHLIKSVRNILSGKKIIDSPEGLVSWAHIENCFHLNQGKQMNLVPKLTESHIDLPVYGGKMKVKLATQVLSHSVSSAIRTMIDMDLMPNEAQATASFCEMFDQLFNIFNSKSFNNANPTKAGIFIGSSSYRKMFEIRDYLLSLKILNNSGRDVSKSFKCISGWIQNIEALRLLLQSEAKSGIDILLTANLNQDAIENFFGVVRQRGGDNERPSAKEFSDSFRQLYCKNIMTPPSSSNCEDDKLTTLLHLEDFEDNSEESNELENSNWPDVPDNILESDTIEQNAFSYVAGRIARFLRKKHPNCDRCSEQCFNPKFGESSTYILKKNYFRSGSSDTKGLLHCEETLFDHVSYCTAVFNFYFLTHFMEPNICHKIVDKINDVNIHNFCSLKIKNLFSGFLVRLLIYSKLKQWNRNYKNEKSRATRKSRKILHQ